jgi:hypothetical protein
MTLGRFIGTLLRLGLILCGFYYALVYVFGLDLSFISPSGVSRNSLKGILKFELTPGEQAMELTSEKYSKKYYMPKWWVESRIRTTPNHRKMFERMNEVADVLWKERVEIDCELEKNRIGHPGTKCAALNNL